MFDWRSAHLWGSYLHRLVEIPLTSFANFPRSHSGHFHEILGSPSAFHPTGRNRKVILRKVGTASRRRRLGRERIPRISSATSNAAAAFVRQLWGHSDVARYPTWSRRRHTASATLLMQACFPNVRRCDVRCDVTTSDVTLLSVFRQNSFGSRTIGQGKKAAEGEGAGRGKGRVPRTKTPATQVRSCMMKHDWTSIYPNHYATRFAISQVEEIPWHVRRGILLKGEAF